MAFDGITIANITKELNDKLTGGRIRKIAQPENDELILRKEPEFIRNVISAETSEKVKYALESVCSRGTARGAYIDGYRVGGKTGTAQKVENGKYLVNNYIMSFMSVVPSNDPEAVLYLAIDNPKNTALLSSYTTTPIARRILLDIIDALGGITLEVQEYALKPALMIWVLKAFFCSFSIIM